MAAGSIVFELLMNTASFETDTKRAEKRLAELKQQAADFGKVVGAGVSAAMIGLTYAVKETIDNMDDLSKSAQKVGTTTEALSALQYAAGLSDVATEDLTVSMAKLAKAATEGNKGLDAMGISTKDAQGNIKDTSALMSEIAAKFAQYKDGAEKTALAQEIFGKSGANLIPLLNSGADGLKEMADEAERLGLIVDGDTAKAAENFNDTLTRMTSAGQGVLTTVASGMLPALQGLADQMLGVASDTDTLSKASAILTTGMRLLVSAVVIVGGAFKTVGTLIGNIAGYIVTGLVSGVESAGKAIVGIGKAVKLAATGDFAGAGKEIAGIGKLATDGAKQAMEGVKIIGGDFVADITGTVNAVSKVWEDGAAKAKAVAADPKGGIAAPIVQGAEKAKKGKKEIDQAAKDAAAAMKKMVDEGNRLTESMRTPFEKLQEEQSKISTLAGAGVISPETQKRALDSAQKQYDDYIKGQQDVLTQGLLSEEEQLKQSYQRRQAEILAATDVSEQARQDALTKLTTDYQSKQQALLMQGLLTEEEQNRASYEKRRAEILAMTESTEADRQNALARLEEDYDKQRAQARFSRYSDLLSEEERITLAYQERRKAIEDDALLSDEERIQYLGTLREQWGQKMTELDEKEAQKRAELINQQKQLVSDGFSGMAELAKAFAGEQSGTYQALFAASKAFALADITIKQSQAIAKAWGENNYWVAAGLTVGLASQFAGLISSASSASFGGTRADGGSVNDGRSYLVGERGPEMFTPNTTGSIIPNNMLAPQQSSQPIRIVNAYDTEHVGDFMGSEAGARVIMNVVKKNGASIKALAES